MDKFGNPIPDEAVIFINGFQLKYHEASDSLEVYTGIPVPALYETQSADFSILLNYLPLDIQVIQRILKIYLT